MLPGDKRNRERLKDNVIDAAREWLKPIDIKQPMGLIRAEFHKREAALAETVNRLEEHIEEYGY